MVEKSEWGRTAERGHYARRAYVVVKEEEAALGDADEKLLVMLYEEVCTQWRDLHDVRFKLLGLLPLVTVGILSFGAGAEGMTGAFAAMIVTALGLGVTHGLHVYDRRNSELYNALISRGRRIEAELGVRTGVYLGRPAPRVSQITHGVATGTIYWSVKVAWLAAFLASGVWFGELYRGA